MGPDKDRDRKAHMAHAVDQPLRSGQAVQSGNDDLCPLQARRVEDRGPRRIPEHDMMPPRSRLPQTVDVMLNGNIRDPADV